MTRKNCDSINAVKTVNGYVFFNVGTPLDNVFFSTVRKLYIDAFILTPTVCVIYLESQLTSPVSVSLISLARQIFRGKRSIGPSYNGVLGLIILV